MQVSNIGEKGLVRIAYDIFSDNLSGESVFLGIGDDAAAVIPGEDLILVSSDITHADTHFPHGSPPYLCGWYAAAVNLSDIASKGGIPLGMLLNIALPRDLPLEWFREVLRGFYECCKAFGTPVIGGDTKYSGRLIMAPTVLGSVRRDGFIPRKGCREGDVVCVTGKLGGSHGSFCSIMNYLKERATHSDDGGNGFWHVEESQEIYSSYERLLKIRPHMDAGRVLSDMSYATCGMDNSDGLAMSLHELARQNGVGFLIEERRLPIDPLLGRIGFTPGEALKDALYEGGDFGLLFTVPPDGIDALKERFSEQKGLPPLYAIGKVTGTGVCMRTDEGIVQLEDRGWEHLREQRLRYLFPQDDPAE